MSPGVSKEVLEIFTGSAGQAQKLADDLGKRFPADTLVAFKYLPTIRAQLALSRNDSSKAIGGLQAAAPYELGVSGVGAFSPTLYPVYVRGDRISRRIRATTPRLSSRNP